MKFALGLLQVGLGFLALVMGLAFSEGDQQVAMGWLVLAYYTDRYKDVIAQREFSASEARQRVRSIVILCLSSLTPNRMR